MKCAKCGKEIHWINYQFGNDYYHKNCLEKIDKQQILEKLKQEQIAEAKKRNIKDLIEIIKNDYIDVLDFYSIEFHGIIKHFFSELHHGEEIKAITYQEPNNLIPRYVILTNKRFALLQYEKNSINSSIISTNISLSDIIVDSIKTTILHPKEPKIPPVVSFKTKNSSYEVFDTPNRQLEKMLKEVLVQKDEEKKQLKKLCPKCGFENEAEDIFCGECGVKFEEITVKKYCRECGNMNNEKNKFCEKCGNKLGE